MSAIITATQLQTFMNQTLVSGLSQQVVDAINQYVETRTKRCFGEIRTVTERYDWGPRIWLRHIDVIEEPDDTTQSTSMTIKLGYPHLLQTTLDATSYFYDKRGRVTMYLQEPFEFNPSAVNNDLVEITYSYGYHELGYETDSSGNPILSSPIVPDDLVTACLGVASQYYNWLTAGNKDIVSVSIGQYKLQYAGSVRGVGGGPSGAAPPVANSTNQLNFDIIERYRMRRNG